MDQYKAWGIGEYSNEMRRLRLQMAYAVSRLGEIKALGRVCADFDLCTHAACQDSYAAWAIADQTLAELRSPDGAWSKKASGTKPRARRRVK